MPRRLVSAAARAVVGPPRQLILLVAALAVWTAWPLLTSDDAGVEGLGGLPWLPVAGFVVVLAVTVAHYTLAAVALRLASGRRPSYRATLATQLAAASVNRVVPGGVGGAAVNMRFLRRAGAPTGDAVTVVLGLGAIGAVADFLFGAGVISLGSVLGLAGGPHELAVLAGHGIRATHRSPWAVVAVAAAVVVAVVLFRLRRVKATDAPTVSSRELLRFFTAHPRRLLAALPASAGTTAVLALGFALCVQSMTVGVASVPPLGALVVVYLVAAAAGTAVPLPAFFGTTEAALVAGLVVSGVPAHAAVVATLVFRLVAFWAPLPVGIVAARRLRVARCL